MDQTFKNNLSEAEQKQIILNLESNVAVGVWLQAIGNIIEVTNLAKLYQLIGETPAERQVLTGVTIQTIGQIVEAIGVTKEIISTDELIKVQADKLAITGDWLQSFGAAIEALGATDVLKQEGAEGFVP